MSLNPQSYFYLLNAFYVPVPVWGIRNSMVNRSIFLFFLWKLILIEAAINTHMAKIISESDNFREDKIEVQGDSVSQSGAGAIVDRVAREDPSGGK